MTDPVDWSLTTFEGNRRAQHLAFLALPFREKLLMIEQLGELAEALARSRAVREALPQDRTGSGGSDLE